MQTVTLCKGPNRAIRALLADRGVGIGDIMKPLAKRVDSVLHDDNGHGLVKSGPIYLDKATEAYLAELTDRTKQVLRAYTFNPVINIGGALLWDRMGRKIDAESVEIANKFLERGR